MSIQQLVALGGDLDTLNSSTDISVVAQASSVIVAEVTTLDIVPISDAFAIGVRTPDSGLSEVSRW